MEIGSFILICLTWLDQTPAVLHNLVLHFQILTGRTRTCRVGRLS